MAASKDRKGVNPSVLIPEEEQSTFGQQSPYAVGFNDVPSSTFPIRSPSIPSAPPVATTSSQPSAATSPQQHPAAAPTVPFAIPAQQSAQHYPEDGQPPPAYDEVAQPPRAPQNYYGDNNNHGYTNPSAPLLPSSGPPATSYSTIPPATSYTPGSPRSTYGDSDDGSRRFNKFWLIFLAVVVLLSITVHDEDDDSGNGSCAFTRPIISHSIPLKINDMFISANGVTTTVILEQRDHAGEDPDMSEIAIIGTARDRDEFRKKLLVQSRVDPSTGQLRLELYKDPGSESNDCMSVTIRLSLSPRMRVMEKLKIIVDEGNVTLAMLLPNHPLQIKDLSTRVVTGYTRIDADVMAMTLGGSVGLIEGNVVVGPSMSVLMVDGYVSLNVTQSTDVMTGKIIVTNGNIDVGLTTPYVGSFRVEAGSGSVGIHHVDMETTKVKYESDKVLKGWRTETGQTPRGRYSSLKLNTHVGTAELDMARQIVL